MCTGGLARGGGGDLGNLCHATATGQVEGPCLYTQSRARFPFTATTLTEHSAIAVLPAGFYSSRANI